MSMDKKYFVALGKFVHAYSRAEAALHFAFPDLAQIDLERSHIIKKESSAGALTAMLKHLIRLGPLSEAEQNDATSCLAQLEHITAFRNTTIHRGARSEEDGFYQATNTATMRNLESLEVTRFTLEDIEAATDDLGRITLRLFNFVDKDDSAYDQQTLQYLHRPWRYRPVQPHKPNSPPPKPKSPRTNKPPLPPPEASQAK